MADSVCFRCYAFLVQDIVLLLIDTFLNMITVFGLQFCKLLHLKLHAKFAVTF